MFLFEERCVTEKFMPELVASLESIPLLELEQGASKRIADLFRNSGRPGLTVAKSLGGGGVSANSMAQILTWVGAHCPSLAIMMTMHHHTIAGMMAGSTFFPEMQGLLSAVAKDRLLTASAFSEGRAHAHNLDSKMSIQRTTEGFIINGSKKPCTMAHHFDLLTLGVNYVDSDLKTHIGIGMAFADNPAIERRNFWATNYLSASDSHEIIFSDLFVPNSLMCLNSQIDQQLDPTQHGIGENLFAIWFQLLAAASYLGMASGLAKRALDHNKGSLDDRAMLLIDLQGASAALQGLANQISANKFGPRDLARAQSIRFSVQEAIHRVSTRAFEILGGIAFLASEEPAYLLVATRLLAFHPTSKLANASYLCQKFS